MLKLCYFEAKHTLELFIAFKMAYSCFDLRVNLDFQEFLQKKFYNIKYRVSNFDGRFEWSACARVTRFVEISPLGQKRLIILHYLATF